MGTLSVWRFLRRHPLTRHRPLGAMAGWVRWQIGARLVPGPVAVPFVGDARLLVSPGMWGATGNVYAGLQEFAEMGFVLHALRPGDLFVDVGANVGAYTVLAGAAVGARVLALEPVPATFEALRANVNLNGIADRVDARNVGAGPRPEVLRFTADRDVTNRVLASGEAFGGPVVEVPVRPLDELVAGLAPPQTPYLIKVDVEGFETGVVQGAAGLLGDPGLNGLIVELRGHGARYGFDEPALHRSLLERGFTPWAYDPLERRLRGLPGPDPAGNTLYLRDVAEIERRVVAAPRFRVQCEEV